MLFEIQRRNVGNTEVISVVGDMDLASLPRLAAALGDLGCSGPLGQVTLDLEGVDYLDPLCLGVLLAADLRVRRGGGEMTVRTGTSVGPLLAETRLGEILTVESV